MTREEAIKELEYAKIKLREANVFPSMDTAIDMAIEALSDHSGEVTEMVKKDLTSDGDLIYRADAVKGWIPVSERLPENSDRYIVTLKDIWAITVRVAVYGVVPQDTHNKKVFWLYDSCYDDLDITEDVVAWMPLPEPYRKDCEA